MADEPISPKKPKSVPEPNPRIMEVEAMSPRPSEWTSVRIGPGEDTVGQDVLAVRVLVTSEDSRYAQVAEGWRQQQGGWGRLHLASAFLSTGNSQQKGLSEPDSSSGNGTVIVACL